VSLVNALRDDETRAAVARDGARMIDAEIAGKKGLRAAALKAGFKTFKKIRPGIIADALDHLLPSFAPAVEPFFVAGQSSGDLKAYFTKHAGDIADAMLSVTDARAERARNKVMKRVYSALRGQAKTHTEQAVPQLAELIQKHV
jgi:hypothetical protein